MSDHHLLRQKELSSDNFELSVGVGVSVAQRQAAKPFMSHLLHYEKICYTSVNMLNLRLYLRAQNNSIIYINHGITITYTT